jgi:hypothetical protein
MHRLAWIALPVALVFACDDAEERRGDTGGGGSGGQAATTGAGAGVTSGSGASGAGPSGLGPVQCRTHEDCEDAGPDATCYVSTPGGMCVDCDPVNGTCPPGTTCETDAMGMTRCVRSCTDDLDCNVGMRCEENACVQRTCAAPDFCPEPYVCVALRCLRPSCAQEPTCPEPLECGTLDHCVEP